MSRFSGFLLAASLLLSRALAPAAAQEIDPEPELLGSASGLLIEASAVDPVWIEAGTRLHKSPHRHAETVSVIDIDVALVPLEHRGEWVRLTFGDRQGWAYLGVVVEPPPAPVESPPAVDSPVLEGLAPDPVRLARALELLGSPGEPIIAGPFQIFTDLSNKRARKLIDQVSHQMAEAYHARYGLEPIREANFAVVIFEREATYREFEDSIATLADLDAAGHAGGGLAALSAHRRTPTEIVALLVHELTHLINRRTFGKTPPPWLEEGMANDLAYCRLDKQGRLEPGTLEGKAFIAEVPGREDRFGRRQFEGTFHIEGPLASLSLLKRSIASNEAVPLQELLDLTWREFADPAGRRLRYVESAFLLRYLIDEVDPLGVRRYLRDYQAGGPSDALTLLTELGLSWQELEEGYFSWVRSHSGQ